MNPFQAPPTDRTDQEIWRDVEYQRRYDPRRILAQQQLATFVAFICLFVACLLMCKVDYLLRPHRIHMPFPIFLSLVIFPLPGTCLLVLRRYLWPNLQIRQLGQALCAGCALGYFLIPFSFYILSALMGWGMY